MDGKGREFKGLWGGASYDRLTSLFGMGPDFYRKAVGEVRVPKDSIILDLGCGTGSLSIAFAQNLKGVKTVHGVDISADQLNHAKKKTDIFQQVFKFHHCSMDALPFPNEYFDVAATSMALHETPPMVRRGAIRETARVLKKEGLFVLVDWGRPWRRILAALWFPFLMFGKWQDNWRNTYVSLCNDAGLHLVEDGYINSITRRQVFKKG